MRFRDLSQSAVESLWSKWKHSIRNLLDEFNDDVFTGNGSIRENSYGESLFLGLETKNGCLYIFPLPGNQFCLRLYRKRVEKLNPNLLAIANNKDEDNFVGGFRLNVGVIEIQYSTTRVTFRDDLEKYLKFMYREYWMTLLCP